MNAQDAWAATLGQLQVQLNRATYNTWLGQARYVAYEEGRLVISVPHAYAKDWLEKHLVQAMSETFGKILQRASEIQVIVWDPSDDDTDVRSLFGLNDDDLHSDSEGLFDPSKTLENFALTPGNRNTLLFANFILDSRFGDHPAMYVAGAPGTGKTHILQAMANVLLKRRLRVVYVNAEQFTTELVAAIRANEMPAFRDKYRACDVLILDEVDFLEGKEASQQELRYVWDTLSRRKRLMIFAGRPLPRDLNVHRDLRSCLNRWLVCEIAPIDADSCAVILDAKARGLSIELPADVRDALVEKIGSDPTMIEGALIQLSNYARLTHQTYSAAMIQSLFKGRDTTPAAPPVELAQVLAATAAHYGLTVDDLISRRRTKVITQARHLAMHLARLLTDAPLLQIGAALGGRDHTTVMHACTKMAETLKNDEHLRADVTAIKRRLSTPASPAPKPAPINTPTVQSLAVLTAHDSIDSEKPLSFDSFLRELIE